MSNDIQLPDVDKASQLIDTVYADAFFSKLAEFGFQPQNEADAVAMLETGMQTDHLPHPEAEKTAAVSPFAAINQELASVLRAEGAIQTPSYEDGIKQAAFAYATAPDVYKSVLALKTAQAEAFAAEQNK
jgi:hypothetical protein